MVKSIENEEEQAEPITAKHVIPQVIEDEMKKSFLAYAMSVIISRALPDVRDGLKPVHRRVLFTMNEIGVRHNSPYKKSARIVGEVMGKYHPHGDSAIYETAVRMAQDFSLRYPLIDGQGNFGSVDGDSPAAMRYTEQRMRRLSEELLADIDKETVDFVENYDGQLKEPTVLPSKAPNLLINGSSGIAVGMATNIPPHNLGEIGRAVIELINNPQAELKDLLQHVKGPDFPTGGIICGTSGIQQAYMYGRGKVRVRAVINEEELSSTQKRLVITEIPYMVNKSMLIEHIATCVHEKKIEGIRDLRDESDRKGMRIVIELKRDANTEVTLNQLYKYTRCQETFGINSIALVNGEPKTLGLKEMIEEFIKHREEVVRRRTSYDLRKAQERAHIIEGLVKALDNINKVIELIKKAETTQSAHQELMSRFSLSDEQSKAILEMKLSRLAALEQKKLREELETLKKLITELNDILDKESRRYTIIKDEIKELIEKYGDARRTQILEGFEGDNIDIEDLIDEEDMVVTISAAGYIKRIPIDTYKAQKRGGKGITAATTKDDDGLEHLFIASTHHFLLIFTDQGRVHWVKVYKLPETGRYSKGTPIVNLISIEKGENVSSVIPVKEFNDGHYLIIATKKGTVKKTTLESYSRPRAGGIKAINLVEDDDVVDVKMTDGTQTIMIATAKGMAVKFDEKDVRPIGRTGTGVRGVRLGVGDYVIGMITVEENSVLATMTENGYGKRTSMSDYRLISRGGKGVRNIICSPRNGKVVAIMKVTDEDDLLFISKKGIVIRTEARTISVIGRNTQGVRLMRLAEGDKVVSAAKIARENGADEDS